MEFRPFCRSYLENLDDTTHMRRSLIQKNNVVWLFLPRSKKRGSKVRKNEQKVGGKYENIKVVNSQSSYILCTF